MVKQIKHRYTYSHAEGGKTIWAELDVVRSKGNGLFDWTVWVKVENIEAPGVWRDKRFSLSDHPNDLLILLARVIQLVPEIENIPGKRALGV